MTDEITGDPGTFDLLGAIEGTTFPETTVPFLFDAEAANALAAINREMQKALILERKDEYEALEVSYGAAREALKGATFEVTLKSIPRKVKKAILAEADAKYKPKHNALTGREEDNFEKVEFYNLLTWRAHIVKFTDPTGKVVNGPLDRELVGKLLDNAPEASIAAVSEAIDDLENGSKAGYEQAVQMLDFSVGHSPEESPDDTPQPSE